MDRQADQVDLSESLFAGLTNPDCDVVTETMHRIIRTVPRPAMVLAPMLVHRSSEVRSLAEEFVVQHATASDAAAYMRTLGDDESESQLIAISALTAMKWQPAVPALIDMYRKADEHRQNLLLGPLVSMEAPEVDDLLVHELQAKDGLRRLLAVVSLSRRRPDEVLPRLLEGTEADEYDERRFAERGLQMASRAFGVRALVRQLTTCEPVERTACVLAIGALETESAVDALVALLNDPGDPTPRHLLAIALGWARCDAAVEPLAELLADADPLVRFHAAAALADLEDPEASQALFKAANDSDAQVRTIVARGLGAKPGSDAVKVLGELLDDEDASVRTSAVVSLREGQTEQVVPHLLRALGDSDASVRSNAAHSFSHHPVNRASEPLCKALGDPDVGVRVAAAESLGEIGHKSAIPALERALSDPEADVRGSAAVSLGMIGGSKAVAALKTARRDKDPDVRQAVEQALKDAREGH